MCHHVYEIEEQGRKNGSYWVKFGFQGLEPLQGRRIEKVKYYIHVLPYYN